MFAKAGAGLLLVALFGLVVFDSKFHFDAELIEVKHKHYSAQRHWNIHYGQQPVYRHSSMRYQADLKKIAELVQPRSVLLSDLASSYYAAAQLPVFIRNVHPHHRRTMPVPWRALLESRYACYLEFEEHRVKLTEFLQKNKPFDYWLVNKDGVNQHRHRDCLAFRAHTLKEELPKFAELLWAGEYLDLYALRETNAPLVGTP